MLPSSKMKLSCALVVVSAIWLCLAYAGVIRADDMIHTITLSGRPLPGFGSAIVTHTTVFRDAVLNNLGQVAYSADLAGSGIEPKNRESYWRYTPGRELELLARSGDPAAGRPGEFFFQTLGPVHITDAGDVQLRSHLVDATGAGALSQRLGDWVWGSDGITKLAYINERTPQLGHYFQAIGSVINNIGQQIRGARSQPVNGIEVLGESLWLLDPNASPTLLAKVGDPAPGLPAGITLARQFTGDFLDSGKILFRMGLAGPSVNATNNLAFWQGDGQGNFELILRAGQPAPGLPDGLLIDPTSFGFVVRLGSGGVQVQSLLSGPGIVGSNNLAFWSYDHDGMKLLAREGDQAPGLPSGVIFSTLSPALKLMGPGIDSSNDLGIWLQQHGGYELAVRKGEHAPDTADGVVFASVSPFGTESFGSNVVQNKSEQFAFLANLTGVGVTDANDVGLWASDRGGVLRLIAREGQELDVDDGPGLDMRTIAGIDLRKFDATGKYLNDLGQVLFTATFTDGAKGIFLSDLVAVPEPFHSAYLACVGSAAVLSRIKRRCRR